ncbi:MAG: site-2 protease family protein [Elusimicrobiota bacterium]|jgi:Zn-dependent protease|nr:site-2 protease family protein [Elusimicrobiota bacterium]
MEMLIYLPILFFSVILHEFAHGFTAYKYGDDTAYLMGRLTFNPMAHIDLVGTIAVPMFCYFANIPMFGWAKPVPVNFMRLHNPKADTAKVSFAGPMSNLFLVILAALILKTAVAANLSIGILGSMLVYAIMINLILAIFNLIPLPPLDGSKILASFLPNRAAFKYMQLERYGMLLVIILLVSGIFSKIVMPIFNFVLRLIFAFIGVSYG